MPEGFGMSPAKQQKLMYPDEPIILKSHKFFPAITEKPQGKHRILTYSHPISQSFFIIPILFELINFSLFIDT
jgi:hypothetical protein